jgi:chaperonin GroES
MYNKTKTRSKYMAEPSLKPLNDRVIVKLVEEQEVKKGGIIIPDSAKEKPQEAKVIAVGPGRLDDNGKRIALELKKGDRVLISKYGGTEVKLDGEQYQILREDDVLAVLG